MRWAWRPFRSISCILFSQVLYPHLYPTLMYCTLLFSSSDPTGSQSLYASPTLPHPSVLPSSSILLSITIWRSALGGGRRCCDLDWKRCFRLLFSVSVVPPLNLLLSHISRVIRVTAELVVFLQTLAKDSTSSVWLVISGEWLYVASFLETRTGQCWWNQWFPLVQTEGSFVAFLFRDIVK